MVTGENKAIIFSNATKISNYIFYNLVLPNRCHFYINNQPLQNSTEEVKELRFLVSEK